MDNSNFNSTLRPNGPHSDAKTNMGGKMNTKPGITEAASHLLEEGKKMANDFYEHNAQKVNDAQETLKAYSHEISNKVQANPLSSIVIAGTIGFLLAKILGK